MPKARHNFSRDAAMFAAQAERQLAQLKSAMKGAEDTLAGLRRGIKAPVPKGGSRTIKGSRSRPSLFETAAINSIGNSFSRGILSDLGLGSGSGSFYSSQGQLTSQFFDQLNDAQRIM